VEPTPAQIEKYQRDIQCRKKISDSPEEKEKLKEGEVENENDKEKEKEKSNQGRIVDLGVMSWLSLQEGKVLMSRVGELVNETKRDQEHYEELTLMEEACTSPLYFNAYV
tara:strand:+ start:205 stop:534 length:330 start_codon:yes stop_codon:yes gene_type:complete